MSTIERDLVDESSEQNRLAAHGRWSAGQISDAILSVIDAGRDGTPWQAFYHPFEPCADSERCDFRDAVLNYLTKGD